jgi:serralysin
MSRNVIGSLGVASAEDEAVRCGAGIVTVLGQATHDRLVGGDRDDVLWGRGGNDVFEGGAGLDTVVYMEATRAVVADLARQVVSFPDQRAAAESLVSIEGVETGAGADVITGSGASNLLLSGAGNDRVAAGAGNDLVRGGRGSDTLDGGSGRDTADYSDHGVGVTVNLAQGFAQVAGTTERDRLTGFEDVTGGDGNDTLVGNLGKDTMTGGALNDIFRFAATSHSVVGVNADVITDFDDFGNDTIDVSALFGPAMIYRHNLGFTAAGQVRINDIAGADVLVEVNTGGSLAADMQIRLTNTTLVNMAANDFFL